MEDAARAKRFAQGLKQYYTPTAFLVRMAELLEDGEYTQVSESVVHHCASKRARCVMAERVEAWIWGAQACIARDSIATAKSYLKTALRLYPNMPQFEAECAFPYPLAELEQLMKELDRAMDDIEYRAVVQKMVPLPRILAYGIVPTEGSQAATMFDASKCRLHFDQPESGPSVLDAETHGGPDHKVPRPSEKEFDAN